MSTDNSTTDANDTALIALRSTLRIGDVGEFKNECETLLAGHPGASLACDASAVEYIDAAALQYLSALARHCSCTARGFEIRTPSAAFSSAAMIAGFGAPLGLS